MFFSSHFFLFIVYLLQKAFRSDLFYMIKRRMFSTKEDNIFL